MTQKLNTDNGLQGGTALRITLYMGWIAASGIAKIAAMRLSTVEFGQYICQLKKSGVLIKLQCHKIVQPSWTHLEQYAK